MDRRQANRSNDDIPQSKRRRLNHSESLSLMDQIPIDVQDLIKEYSATNYDNISFIPNETPDIEDPMGDTEFKIMDLDWSDVKNLGIFKFIWDFDYRRIDLNDYFQETGFYYHDNKSEFIRESLLKLINFIFEYKNKHYSTIKISNYYVDDHQINLKEYQPYITSGAYWLFRKPVPNPLFNRSNVKYNKCTLLVKNKGGFVTNETTFGNTLQFERKCLIVDYNLGGQISIYFDYPITFIDEDNWHMDIAFKLKINNIIVTGNEFMFSTSKYSENDRNYRLGKYCKVYKKEWYFLNNCRAVLSYSSMHTRRGNEYSYGIFENAINNRKEIQIIYPNELNEWDDEMINELNDLENDY